MSLRNKKKNLDTRHAMPPEVKGTAEVEPRERALLERLRSERRFVDAVNVAVGIHQRVRSAASEELRRDAWEAHIRWLVGREADREALARLNIVQALDPAMRERLKDVAPLLEARNGGVEGLMGLLADDGADPAKRASIEARIRREAGDPARIAACDVLPAEHPLRVAAAAVARALDAVTRGPVAAESLALPEVSRSSPLAPWKMMVRAIAAFYAQDDALCEKYLSAVEPTAAASRLCPALRAMMGQKAKLTPAALTLAAQADGGRVALGQALAAVDAALERRDHKSALFKISRAVAACKMHRPKLVVALKQRMSVGAMLAGLRAGQVAQALGGPSLKNASFWRMLARAHEEDRAGPLDVPLAASAWNEFLKHAVHERWFPAQGPEIATVYLHMLELLRRIPQDEQEGVARSFHAGFTGWRESYKGQPPEVRDVTALTGRDDFYYLSPDGLLERACAADPRGENFEAWLKRAKDNGERGDEVAAQWAAARPLDIPPVLHLMQSAERRSAFRKAFRLMEQAELLDGLNPDVRKARLRLLVSMALRHLRQMKARLAEPELAQIEALPQAQQGDRPALVAGLRWVYWTLCGGTAQAAAARLALGKQMDDHTAADCLLLMVLAACEFKGSMPELQFKSPGLAGALGRVCALGEDTGLPVEIPDALSKQLMRELLGKEPARDGTGLAALGALAIRGEDFALAYAVSVAGLKLADEWRAEFLFLRAQAMPVWSEERQALCAAAASELARRQRNLDLLRRIGKWREEEFMWFDHTRADVAMTTPEINELVAKERTNRGYPAKPPRSWMESSDDGPLCDCAACRANRRGTPRELEELVDSMPPELAKVLKGLGPEELMRAMEEIAGGGPPKRRRRPRMPDDEDIPF